MPSATAISDLVTLAVVGVGGLLVCVFGLRGRREGDTPHCRKCAYNLTGLTSERCPECGSPVSGRNVVRGVYRPRWTPLVAGAAVVLGCGWMLGGVAYPHVRMLNVRHHYPFQWLIDGLRTGDRLSYCELLRRDSVGSLSESETNQFIEMALAEQQRSSTPINRQSWMFLLERWDKTQSLDSKQRTQFYRDLRLVNAHVYLHHPGFELIRNGDRLNVSLYHGLESSHLIRWIDARISVGGRSFPVTFTPWPGTAGSSTEGNRRYDGTELFVPHLDVEPGRRTWEFIGHCQTYPRRQPDDGSVIHSPTEEVRFTGEVDVRPIFRPS